MNTVYSVLFVFAVAVFFGLLASLLYPMSDLYLLR